MKLIKLLSIAVLILAFASCSERKKSADAIQAGKTAESLKEANRQIGMPNITNYAQRKALKNILELCDKENLICYAYLQNQYTGKLVFIGKCFGYGIPFSAQFTNPQKIVDLARASHVYESMPQADPNGLFMPTSSSATWLMMVDPDGKPRPMYVEPSIVVSPFPLELAVGK